jgi:hypothetical protein
MQITGVVKHTQGFFSYVLLLQYAMIHMQAYQTEKYFHVDDMWHVMPQLVTTSRSREDCNSRLKGT